MDKNVVKEKKIDKNKKIKEKISFVLLILIAIILVTISSLYIYQSFNKESGVYNIFRGAKKGELKSDEASNLSQKYIEAIYNKKVTDFNILKQKDKYYFYSSVADVVLDKTNGKTYFDKLTSKEEFNNNPGFIKKDKEVLKRNNEEMDKFIYINIKQSEKTEDESVVDEVKKMIFKLNDKKLDISNDEKNNIEAKLKNISDLQAELKDMLKIKKEAQEKNNDTKDIDSKIKDIQSRLDKKLNELNFNGIKITKGMNLKVDQLLFLNNKERDVKEGHYTNGKEFLNSLLVGYIDDGNILVLKENSLYTFSKIENEEYFDYIEEMNKDIYDEAYKIKNLIFTSKEFTKYLYDNELQLEDSYNTGNVYFYLNDTVVINKTSYIKMEFNLKNKEIIDIDVRINNIPYSEVKIDRYTASTVAYNFLKENNYIKDKEKENEKEEPDIEYTKIEIDNTNTFYNKDVKPGIEKMWKIKFIDIPEVVFIDSYYGIIIGGEK